MITQRKRLVELLKKSPIDKCLDVSWNEYFSAIADYLLDNGVRRVVRCCECEYLGIKGLVDGYCKKDIMGLVSPNDYCSRGKLKEDKQLCRESD